MTIAVFCNLVFRCRDAFHCNKFYVWQWFSLVIEMKELSYVSSGQVCVGTPVVSKLFWVLGSLQVFMRSGYLYKHQYEQCI